MRVTCSPYMHERQHTSQLACRKRVLYELYRTGSLGLNACSQPTDMKTNVSSDHMKENSLQNINHLLHHIYQCGISISTGIWERIWTQVHKQIIKTHPFPCNIHTHKNTHTQISPLAPHPKPLGAHFLIIQALMSSLSGRIQWMASRALRVCASLFVLERAVYACI